MTYTSLHNFGTLSGKESGGVYLNDSSLYVVMEEPVNSGGSIYKINLNNNSFSTVTSISGGDYFYSITGKGDKLYSYQVNSSSGNAAIYKVDGVNGNVSKLADLDSASVGYLPNDAYLILGKETLYGITTLGSDNDKGAVFSCDTSNGSISKILALSQSTGYEPFRVHIQYDSTSSTGLSEYTVISNSIKCFPNPASEILNIDIDRADVVRIYGSSGTLVALEQGKNSISISDLKNGMYMVVVNRDEKVFTARFIKN